ncbi:MAG: prepilin-type N-terminal cleavage/methylation domain-containing protein [Vicinamibacterales bacterium]
MRTSSSRGFSLIELTFALGIIAVAVLGLAGVMASGMKHLSNSPQHVIAAQEAAQAVEAVFAARDSHKNRLVGDQEPARLVGQRWRRLHRRSALAL